MPDEDDDLLRPRPRVLRNAIKTAGESATTTFERWAKANGYDPKTRTYRECEAPVGAVPGAHCGAHQGKSWTKVA